MSPRFGKFLGTILVEQFLFVSEIRRWLEWPQWRARQWRTGRACRDCVQLGINYLCSVKAKRPLGLSTRSDATDSQYFPSIVHPLIYLAIHRTRGHLSHSLKDYIVFIWQQEKGGVPETCESWWMRRSRVTHCVRPPGPITILHARPESRVMEEPAATLCFLLLSRTARFRDQRTFIRNNYVQTWIELNVALRG